MRTRSRFLPVAASLALLLTAVPVAQAQEESPAASPSPFCAVLTPEEIASTLGIEVSVSDSTDVDCTYQADFESGVFLLVNVRHEDGTVEELKEFFTDHTDVTVAGRPAILALDATLLFVGLDDGLFTVQLVGSPAEGIDQAAAITSLAETALPRLASIPLPTAEPEPSAFPMPSFVGDPELVALFPATLGGAPLEIQSLTGQELAASGDPEDMASVEAALAAFGKTMDDMSFAFGFSADGSIVAIRVKDVDALAIFEQLLPLLLEGVDEPVQTRTTIAGKSVVKVTDGPDTDGADAQYLYPKDDVIWQVIATEPVLTEAFTGLP